MKIDSNDPLSLNKLGEKNQKQVQESNKSSIDPKLEKRREVLQGKGTLDGQESNCKEELEKAVAQANEATKAVNVELSFRIHEETERKIVEVVDLNKEEVIREIPPEKLLNLIGKIQETIGFLLDERK